MIRSGRNPGSYILQLNLASTRKIRIGKLGCFIFSAGSYVYTGSAFGPGGIAARLHRHNEKEKVKHWHIDFLRSECDIERMLVLFAIDKTVETWPTGNRIECIWSQEITALDGVTIPVIGFGSSDCISGCRSHLLLLPKDTSMDIKQILENITPGIEDFDISCL